MQKKMSNPKVQSIIDGWKILKDLSKEVNIKINLLVKWFKI